MIVLLVDNIDNKIIIWVFILDGKGVCLCIEWNLELLS